ncbi:uncharacterized protein DUF3616 [Pontibacter ummariensis]|uniref:DUF3616 domain-containing protein n=1 Tax=Pontibacter ummariensis TaxID=1610492 RepID=A0A239KAM6_9BACT|nr:DUF3616 domain-containing protein [Pontibacter ummariensis]PRY06059.1 uncharacterized protein DUF3616 [Pontibacter ummariensis]SNT14689.1 Protein of unknown function [Pontibacter ummariensis]
MRKNITLRFDPELSLNPEGKHVRDGLSTVLRTGNDLWLSCDERLTVERLTRSDDGSFAKHRSFNLGDYLDLPAKDGGEIDIEGMGIANNYLWIVGSHSLKRRKPRRHDSVAKQMKRLSKVKSDPNRYLLARIPILQDEETGHYVIYKSCEDPDRPGHTLRAAQLKGDTTSSVLTDVLQHDEHVSPFMHIPGKDNGFDIEGLAISGSRIFIGLRGPVLRGWAMVLEIETEEDEQGVLHLKQVAENRPYKKHFLNLRGKGVRELRVFGEDIYILAGPTMDLDGVIAIYRWPGAISKKGEQMVHNNELERLCEVPHGTGDNSGKDKAEGLTTYDEKHVLIVYDSPTDARKVGEDAVLADLIQVIP